MVPYSIARSYVKQSTDAAFAKQAGIWRLMSDLATGGISDQLFDFASDSPWQFAGMSVGTLAGLAGLGLGGYALTRAILQDLASTRRRKQTSSSGSDRAADAAESSPRKASDAALVVPPVVPGSTSVIVTHIPDPNHQALAQAAQQLVQGVNALTGASTEKTSRAHEFEKIAIFKTLYALGKWGIAKPLQYFGQGVGEMSGVSQFFRRGQFYRQAKREFGPALDELIDFARREYQLKRPLGHVGFVFNPTERLSERYIPQHYFRWFVEKLQSDPVELQRIKTYLKSVQNEKAYKHLTPDVIQRIVTTYGPNANAPNAMSLGSGLLFAAIAGGPLLKMLYDKMQEKRRQQASGPLGQFWYHLGSQISPYMPELGAFVQEHPYIATAGVGAGLAGLGYGLYTAYRAHQDRPSSPAPATMDPVLLQYLRGIG